MNTITNDGTGELFLGDLIATNSHYADFAKSMGLEDLLIPGGTSEHMLSDDAREAIQTAHGLSRKTDAEIALERNYNNQVPLEDGRIKRLFRGILR